MAILVTGGAGYIGSHMVWNLIDKGEKVIVADRLSTGFDWAVAPEATLMRGDIGDVDFLRSIFQNHSIEAIIHFAGSIVVPESVTDPLGYYNNNTIKSHRLVEEAIAHKVDKFIFSSTAAVYGNVGEKPVIETAPTLPQSPYGRSKLMTEFMLLDAALAHDFNFTALRYFNVSGADPLGRTGQSTIGATHLIKVACEVATGKRASMQVFGTDYDTKDGTCIRDYIHVTDLVEAHYLALQRLRNGGKSAIMNCGYGIGFSVLDVLNAVRKVSGQLVSAENFERRLGDAVSVVANSDLAKQELDWKPQHNDLELIVKTALDWEKSLAYRNNI
jgi:UDP-glucose 4-epimerase